MTYNTHMLRTDIEIIRDAPRGARSPVPSIRYGDSIFHRLHLVLPMLGLATGTAILMFGGGDLWWAKQLYALQGGSWALRQGLVTEDLIHRGGRLLSVVAWLGVLGLWIRSYARGRAAAWRRGATYLLFSVACSTALVTGLKRLVVQDCAWSVEGLGGKHRYLTLTDPRPPNYRVDHCFPAAHASTGYAWMALYFAGFATPRRRRLGLAVGLGAGLLFGMGQQLRGAHFASHDLWSAALCWVVALAFLPLLRRQPT